MLLGAIRRDVPAPTVHSRNLFHLSAAMFDAWTAYGPLETCVAKIQGYIDAGFDMITIRLTAWDQTTQYRIYTQEVLPALRARMMRAS